MGAEEASCLACPAAKTTAYLRAAAPSAREPQAACTRNTGKHVAARQSDAVVRPSARQHCPTARLSCACAQAATIVTYKLTHTSCYDQHKLTHHSAASPASRGWSARAGAGRSARTAPLQTCAPAFATGANGRHVANTKGCTRGQSQCWLQPRHPHARTPAQRQPASVPLLATHAAVQTVRCGSTTRQAHAQNNKQRSPPRRSRAAAGAGGTRGAPRSPGPQRCLRLDGISNWMPSEVQWFLSNQAKLPRQHAQQHECAATPALTQESEHSSTAQQCNNPQQRVGKATSSAPANSTAM